MQFTTTAVFTLLAAAVSAAPAPQASSAVVSKMADTAQWTITGFTRTCNDEDTSCEYKFGINTGSGDAASCDYTIKADSKASRASVGGVTCADSSYVVSSSWSDYFGEDQGFTTLSVLDSAQRLIVWPAYTDAQINNGEAVSPDQAYAPVNLA